MIIYIAAQYHHVLIDIDFVFWAEQDLHFGKNFNTIYTSEPKLLLNTLGYFRTTAMNLSLVSNGAQQMAKSSTRTIVTLVQPYPQPVSHYLTLTTSNPDSAGSSQSASIQSRTDTNCYFSCWIPMQRRQ